MAAVHRTSVRSALSRAVPTAVAALVASTFGCQQAPQHFQTIFDPCAPIALSAATGTRPDELAGIGDAIAMWKRVASVELATDAIAGARRLPIQFETGIWYDGSFDDLLGRITIARQISDPHVRAVVIAHELGHAMSLYHVPASDRRSVMNPGNRTVEPTADDGAALARVWGDCAAPPP